MSLRRLTATCHGLYSYGDTPYLTEFPVRTLYEATRSGTANYGIRDVGTTLIGQNQWHDSGNYSQIDGYTGRVYAIFDIPPELQGRIENVTLVIIGVSGSATVFLTECSAIPTTSASNWQTVWKNDGEFGNVSIGVGNWYIWMDNAFMERLNTGSTTFILGLMDYNDWYDRFPVTSGLSIESTIYLDIQTSLLDTEVEIVPIRFNDDSKEIKFYSRLKINNDTMFTPTYEWTFGDGTTGTGNPVYHTYTESGRYDVESKVYTTYYESYYGDYAYSKKRIALDAPMETSLDFYTFYNYGLAPQTAYFGDTSEYADFNPRHWVWDMGDGTTLTGENVKHTYTAPGVYDVTMDVNDETNHLVLTKKSIVLISSTETSNGIQIDFSENNDDYLGNCRRHIILSRHSPDNPEDNKLIFRIWSPTQGITEEGNITVAELNGSDLFKSTTIIPMIGDGFVIGNEILRWSEFISKYIKADSAESKRLQLWSGE